MHKRARWCWVPRDGLALPPIPTARAGSSAGAAAERACRARSERSGGTHRRGNLGLGGASGLAVVDALAGGDEAVGVDGVRHALLDLDLGVLVREPRHLLPRNRHQRVLQNHLQATHTPSLRVSAAPCPCPTHLLFLARHNGVTKCFRAAQCTADAEDDGLSRLAGCTPCASTASTRGSDRCCAHPSGLVSHNPTRLRHSEVDGFHKSSQDSTTQRAGQRTKTVSQAEGQPRSEREGRGGCA
eukprot:3600192-Rhodomonas_salina.1